MPAAGRVSDLAQVSQDAHGCPGCPHPGVGPAVIGSTDVNIEDLPALRQDDIGVHTACCGPNLWTATKGAPHVNINGKPAMRVGDETTHCGGNKGKIQNGAKRVNIGDGGGDGGGGGGGGGGGNGGAGGGSSGSGDGSRYTGGDNGGGGAPAQAAAASPAKDQPAKDEPLLVGAVWGKPRIHFGERVTLRASCNALAGQSATFTLHDCADDSTVTTLNAACGEGSVETEWHAPGKGPPHQLWFEVAAGGKSAQSKNLDLVVRVEVTLILDLDGSDEPAAERAVALLASPSGARVRGRTDKDGKVVFDEAPSGDGWKLILED